MQFKLADIGEGIAEVQVTEWYDHLIFILVPCRQTI